MSTDYKAMLESTSNHQPTVSNPVEAVVSCDLKKASEDLFFEFLEKHSHWTREAKMAATYTFYHTLNIVEKVKSN